MRTRGRVRASKTIRYSSHNARLAWGATSLAMALVGIALALPSFERTAIAPGPWGLWVSDDGKVNWRKPPGALLSLEQVSNHDCTAKTTFRGSLGYDSSSFDSRTRPRRLVLAASRIKIHRAEVADSSGERAKWVEMHLRKFRNVYVAWTDEGPWFGDEGENVDFRMELDSYAHQGYGSCFARTPGLFEFVNTWHEAQDQAMILLGGKRFSGRSGTDTFAYQVATRASVSTSVAGMEPDRGTMPGNASVSAREATVSCSNPTNGLGDSNPAAFQQNDCGTTISFRDPASAGDLNRRVFLAGLLLSASIGIALECVMGSVSGRRRFVNEEHDAS